MTTAYIAHFYPDIDAPTHFQVGSVIQVLAPVFGSYSEAARQLAEDIDDIDEAELPVSAYIIEAEPVAGGYEILDVYAVVDDRPKKTRTRNAGIPPTYGREKNARAGRSTKRDQQAGTPPAQEGEQQSAPDKKDTPGIYAAIDYSQLKPIGEAVLAEKVPKEIIEQLGSSRVAKMRAPKDISAGDEGFLDVNRAAEYYAQFMAKKAPKGVSARKITGEFNRQMRGATESKLLKALAEARKEGRQNLWEILKNDVKNANSNAGLVEPMVEADGIIRILREEQNKLDPKKSPDRYKELARDISKQNKRYEILGYLLAYCPICEGEVPPDVTIDQLRSDNLKKLAERINLTEDFNPESLYQRSKQQAIQKAAEEKMRKALGLPKPGTSSPVTPKATEGAQQSSSSGGPGGTGSADAMSDNAPSGVRKGFESTPQDTGGQKTPPQNQATADETGAAEGAVIKIPGVPRGAQLAALDASVSTLARAMSASSKETWESKLAALADTLAAMKSAYVELSLSNNIPVADYIDQHIIGDLQAPDGTIVPGVDYLSANKKPGNKVWRDATKNKFDHTFAVMTELPFEQNSLYDRYNATLASPQNTLKAENKEGEAKTPPQVSAENKPKMGLFE